MMHDKIATNAAYPPKLPFADKITYNDNNIIIIFNLYLKTFLMVSERPYDFPVSAFFDFINKGNIVQKRETKKAVTGMTKPIPTMKNKMVNAKIYIKDQDQLNMPHISPSFQVVLPALSVVFSLNNK